MTSSPLNAQPSRDPIAQVRDLVKTFGDGDAEVRAVDGVSIDLFRGEFTAIMGPSGSGKSTFMHCLAGLDPATSGTMLVNRQSLMHMSDKELTRFRRQNIGFIFQAFNLLPTLTAEQNIRLPMELARQKIDENYFDLVVDTVGLRPRLDHRPAEMSGGQQQRVACARALVAKPSIIFADEPTGNLDSVASDDVLTFLRRSVDDFGQTIVMVTHEPSAAAYADRVLFLADGKFFAELRNPDADTVLEYMGRTRRAAATPADDDLSTAPPPAAASVLAPAAVGQNGQSPLSTNALAETPVISESAASQTPAESTSATVSTTSDCSQPAGPEELNGLSQKPHVSPEMDMAPPVGPAIGFAGPPASEDGVAPATGGTAGDPRNAAASPAEEQKSTSAAAAPVRPNAHMDPQSMALPTFNSALSSAVAQAEPTTPAEPTAPAVATPPPAPAPIVIPNASARGSVQRPTPPAAKPTAPQSAAPVPNAVTAPKAAGQQRATESDRPARSFRPNGANIAAAAAAAMTTPAPATPKPSVTDMGRNARAESAHARQPATHPAVWTAQTPDSTQASGSAEEAVSPTYTSRQKNAGSTATPSSPGSVDNSRVTTQPPSPAAPAQPAQRAQAAQPAQRAQRPTTPRATQRHSSGPDQEPQDYFATEVRRSESRRESRREGTKGDRGAAFPWDRDNARAYQDAPATRNPHPVAEGTPEYGQPWTEPQPAVDPERPRYSESRHEASAVQPVRPQPAPEVRPSRLLDDPLAAAARRPMQDTTPRTPVRPKPPAARVNPTQAQAQVRPGHMVTGHTNTGYPTTGSSYLDDKPMLSIDDLPTEPEYYDDEVDVA